MREIYAKLIVEECRRSSTDSSVDAERQYVVHTKHFLVEGEMYITCRPSKLEETLRQAFKIDSAPSSRYGSYYSSSSSSTVNRKERRFLTRDAIYAPPTKEVHDQIKEVGRVVLGRDPGDGFDIMCDILDEMISPPKRTI